jgi:hypothetical protein
MNSSARWGTAQRLLQLEVSARDYQEFQFVPMRLVTQTHQTVSTLNRLVTVRINYMLIDWYDLN